LIQEQMNKFSSWNVIFIYLKKVLKYYFTPTMHNSQNLNIVHM
jgi:hypothetical protein